MTTTGEGPQVVEPDTAAEFAAALRGAADRRQSVLIRGAGTKIEWGRVAERVDVVLGTRRMNRLVAHQHGDRRTFAPW